MATDHDIVAISIPFTVGVVAAAAMPFGMASYRILALCCSAGLVSCMILAARKGRQVPVISALFFILGLWSYCNSKLEFSFHPIMKQYAEQAMSAFCTRIDGLGLEKAGPILKALLTGNRTSLGKECIADFRRSGASHLLALSGLHLGIIYALLDRILAILGNSIRSRIIRSFLIISACGAYSLATGSGPSISRAFLFVVVRETLKISEGRKISGRRPLCLALLIQLTVTPEAIDSIGFQLSYLAMTGICLLSPTLESWYPVTGRIDLMRKIWKSAAMSVSCQIFTAPLVWLKFGTFPQYFLITNLFALPLTSLLASCGVMCLILDCVGICPEILKGLCDMLAQALLSVIETIASL